MTPTSFYFFLCLCVCVCVCLSVYFYLSLSLSLSLSLCLSLSLSLSLCLSFNPSLSVSLYLSSFLSLSPSLSLFLSLPLLSPLPHLFFICTKLMRSQFQFAVLQILRWSQNEYTSHILNKRISAYWVFPIALNMIYHQQAQGYLFKPYINTSL